MKRLAILIVLALTAASCSQRIDPDFLQSPDIRLEVMGVPCLTYDENGCQLGFNAAKCEFRVLSDNASDYYILVLDAIPQVQSEKICGSITWTTANSIESRKNVVFKVMKLENDTVWLWNADNQIAVCVRVLV